LRYFLSVACCVAVWLRGEMATTCNTCVDSLVHPMYLRINQEQCERDTCMQRAQAQHPGPLPQVCKKKFKKCKNSNSTRCMAHRVEFALDTTCWNRPHRRHLCGETFLNLHVEKGGLCSQITFFEMCFLSTTLPEQPSDTCMQQT
jgi:hypothetical protein